jgi:threonine/homoserine/homoserine lactone efflux protein
MGTAALPYEIFTTLGLGFLIGLTGALAPGPTLVATINASLTGNWTAGLKISFGHMLAETVIFLLIILGLAGMASPYTSVIGAVGGIALMVFGIMTITGSRKATLRATPAQTVSSPYVSGFLTSAANPYFWIWWLSVGSALLIKSLEGGLLLAGIFMIGHWGADTGWYTFISTGISRGKKILSDAAYHRIMAACGIFLILFGIYYLSGVMAPYL